jgi:hypothetical protein
MANAKLHCFLVTGRDYFPLDMLRVDMCWPATITDAEAINEHDHRAIALTSCAIHAPSIALWASHLWTVKEK